MANPPQLVLNLFQAVAAIHGYEGPLKTLIHPINVRAFSLINIVDVHKENLQPFRNFAARHSVEEICKLSKAAANLYIWCRYVDEAYKMTNKTEFRVWQEKKIIFSAQAPMIQKRERFGGGSFFNQFTE